MSGTRKKEISLNSDYLSIPIMAILISFSGLAIAQDCSTPAKHTFIPYAKTSEFSKINGRRNNLTMKRWGSAGTRLLRVVPADRSRQPGTRKNRKLPSPREISNAISDQKPGLATRNAKGLSDMFWLWGQFLDHDITLVHTDPDNPSNISLSSADKAFFGVESLPFNRSVKKTNNTLSSFIDGSNIYGANNNVAKSLRSFKGGKLILKEGLLPTDTDGFFRAGDERANEHIGLTAMHTLWVREHNRIADAIACQHPNWGDSRLFKEARRIVIAELQAITYNEFLPAMLGWKSGLPGYWDYDAHQSPGYDPEIKPNISHIFAVASYRFGHSMLSSELLRLNEDGTEINSGHISLKSAFFRPNELVSTGIDPILRGLASQTAQALDPTIVDDVRNFLILGSDSTQGFDLAALNIQRGRDHKLPGYNDVREALGLRPIDNFYDSIWQWDFQDKLSAVYKHPNDIDLWVGVLAETQVNNSLVGETLRVIIMEQFRRLRHGDRFWYENHFFGAALDELNATTLADIIKRNTSIKHIQNNALIASNRHQPRDGTAHRPHSIMNTKSASTDSATQEQIRMERISDAIQKGYFE